MVQDSASHGLTGQVFKAAAGPHHGGRDYDALLVQKGNNEKDQQSWEKPDFHPK